MTLAPTVYLFTRATRILGSSIGTSLSGEAPKLFCTKCGTNLPDKHQRCPSCGYSKTLDNSNVPQTATADAGTAPKDKSPRSSPQQREEVESAANAISSTGSAAPSRASILELPVFEYGPNNKYKITFNYTTGTVVSVSKRSETHVSGTSIGGGGGGYVHPQHGGHISVSAPSIDIRSEVATVLEFFLKDSTGKERDFTFRNADLPLHTGQRVTIVTVAAGTGFLAAYVKPREWVLFVNHDLGKHWRRQASYSTGRWLAAGGMVYLVYLVFCVGPFASVSNAVASVLSVCGLYIPYRVSRVGAKRKKDLERVKSHLDGLARTCYRVLG